MYIKQVPEIERKKWSKKLKSMGESCSDELSELVKNNCYVTRLKMLMKNKSIEIVKRSIGPVKAKLEELERIFNLKIEKLETQIFECNVDNIKRDKARFDDEFQQKLKQLYSGVLFHQGDKYGLKWYEEMIRFFSKRNLNISHDDKEWIKKYYIQKKHMQNTSIFRNFVKMTTPSLLLKANI